MNNFHWEKKSIELDTDNKNNTHTFMNWHHFLWSGNSKITTTKKKTVMWVNIWCTSVINSIERRGVLCGGKYERCRLSLQLSQFMYAVFIFIFHHHSIDVRHVLCYGTQHMQMHHTSYENIFWACFKCIRQLS